MLIGQDWADLMSQYFYVDTEIKEENWRFGSTRPISKVY